MKNMKNFVAFMAGCALIGASFMNVEAKAYYSEETYYYDTYENMIEMKDEGTFKCSAENMRKLASIYTDDDTNDLIEAYKGAHIRNDEYVVQFVVMVGYEVNGYYFYRTYVMMCATYDATYVEVTDVSMKWHCIEFDKIEDCYEWDYA